MSTVLKDARVWVAGFDLSGDFNAVGLEYGATDLDDTRITQSTRRSKGGLKTAGISHQGFWNGGANEVDDVLFEKIGVEGEVMTIAPDGEDDGDAIYTLKLMHASYQLGGQIGELLPFSVEGVPADVLVRGNILHSGELSVDTDGTAIELGAVASGKALYGALHVFSGSGDLDVKIQSSSDQAFTSPNDRITFTQVGTAVPRASQWSTAAGPITDTWWRMTATVPGTRTFAVAMGIR